MPILNTLISKHCHNHTELATDHTKRQLLTKKTQNNSILF